MRHTQRYDALWGATARVGAGALVVAGLCETPSSGFFPLTVLVIVAAVVGGGLTIHCSLLANAKLPAVAGSLWGVTVLLSAVGLGHLGLIAAGLTGAFLAGSPMVLTEVLHRRRPGRGEHVIG